ncbi:NAD-dependent dehydratase [uncultured Gammaproteobacteria bacterium]
MLTHLLSAPVPLARVVVIGAGGFIGGAVARRLAVDGVPVLALTRAEVDLLAGDGSARLVALLKPGDAVVAASAIAPCKTVAILADNLRLVNTMVAALAKVAVGHVINIGSDAVFADEPVPLTEASPRSPDSLHGVMHLARELAFAAEVGAPQATIRPTLVYGACDPHNGYGPNRFRRLANAGRAIALFGEGEERRDHVLVDDVAELVVRALYRRSTGSLNAASGEVYSFRAMAELTVQAAGRPVAITGGQRSGPMPHNGYRPFEIQAIRTAFPDFIPTPFAAGVVKVQQQVASGESV